jgi:hypothetical protein
MFSLWVYKCRSCWMFVSGPTLNNCSGYCSVKNFAQFSDSDACPHYRWAGFGRVVDIMICKIGFYP